MALRFSTLAIGALLASAAAQHVLLPFSQRSDVPGLAARASEQTPLKSAEYTYLVEVEVGTPAQQVTLLISPTTGDTWVPDTNTIECSPEWYYRDSYDYYDDMDDYDYDIPATQCKWGSFNKTLSSTYLPANQRYSDFGASYIDGSSVSGTNMTDRLVLGGIEFADYPIGLVSYSTDRWIGVLGLGHNDTTTSSSYYSNEYSNIMDRMVSSGKIASSAYSMWLDDADGSSGGLLFGAVDQSRYTGGLVRTSAQSRYSSSSHFVAALSSVNGTSASGEAMPSIRSNDFPIDVTLGPAEVFSFLPELVADQIADMAGATFNRSVRYFTIACDAGKTNNTKLVFELAGAGGPTLNVETADLVLPASFVDRFGRRITDGDQCLFGIQKYSGSSSTSNVYNTYNLGSSVLRRSYLVFDLVNEEIAVAPVRFRGSDAPSPTIVAFESYGAYAPSATSVCTGRYCRSDDGDSDWHGGFRGGYGGRGYPGREHWEKVAIGLGVSFGVLVLVGLVVTVVICVRLRREKAAKGADEESEGDESAAPAVAQNGTRGSMLPGSLPVIQEGPEPTTQAAPQLPALGTQLAGTITPPEPTASANSDRPSVAVSALSDEPQTQTGEPAAVDSETPTPKGKGKEADRPTES
jgi:hypothetical protein